jgi:hypothetical protein
MVNGSIQRWEFMKKGGDNKGERGRGTHKTVDTFKLDLPPQAGAVPDERAEDGEPGTEHSGGILGLEVVRDGED